MLARECTWDKGQGTWYLVCTYWQDQIAVCALVEPGFSRSTRLYCAVMVDLVISLIGCWITKHGESHSSYKYHGHLQARSAKGEISVISTDYKDEQEHSIPKRGLISTRCHPANLVGQYTALLKVR